MCATVLVCCIFKKFTAHTSYRIQGDSRAEALSESLHRGLQVSGKTANSGVFSLTWGWEWGWERTERGFLCGPGLSLLNQPPFLQHKQAGKLPRKGTERLSPSPTPFPFLHTDRRTDRLTRVNNTLQFMLKHAKTERERG